MDEEETSFTDSENRNENVYEKIEVRSKKFNKTPVSTNFGSVNEK